MSRVQDYARIPEDAARPKQDLIRLDVHKGAPQNAQRAYESPERKGCVHCESRSELRWIVSKAVKDNWIMIW